MPPVYPSDRAASQEEEDIRPRTGLSVIGLLWIGAASMGGSELVKAGVAPIALVLAGAGAALPLLVARLRGSRDVIPVSVWVLAAALYVAGVVVTAVTAGRGELDEMKSVVVRVLLTTQVAVSSLLFACGGYFLSRSIGSVPQERRVIYVGSAVALGLGLANGIALLVLYGHGLQGDGSLASALLPLLIWCLQIAAVVWTYVRVLAARPTLRRIARVFE